MTYHEAGKGSRQRPGTGYADGWEAIWGKKMKWQPIETIPEDGPVLLFVPKFGTSYTAWASGGEFFADHSFDGGDVATHWMPLPEPPESN